MNEKRASRKTQRVLLNGQDLEWIFVISKVSQESKLGRIPFIVYIRDLEIGLESTLSHFHYDIKERHSWKPTAIAFKRVPGRAVPRFEKWQVPFRFGKCQVMHVRPRNSNHPYNVGGRPQQVALEALDLEITISSDLKSIKHCKLASRRANTVSELIAKILDSKTRKLC